MKKIYLVPFACLILLCTFISSAWTELYGTITRIEGEVLFQPEDRTKWFPAKTRLGLKEGDKIKTGENSFATLVFDDGSSLHIKENSSLSIEKLVIDLAKKISTMNFNVPKKGSFLANIRRIFCKPKFEIRTPIAVASIRGTDLSLETDENTTNVMVFEGRVIVKDFVEESALPRDGEELLLVFLHEVSLKPNRMVTITKKGITRPKRIKKETALKIRKELEELKEHSDKIQQEQKEKTFEEKQKERKELREKILTKL